MKLEVLHLERIRSPMLREPAAKVRDGVDELVRDVEEQLEHTYMRSDFRNDARGEAKGRIHPRPTARS